MKISPHIPTNFYLLIFCAIIIYHVVFLYLQRTVLIDDIIPTGHIERHDLTPSDMEHTVKPKIQPRVLYSTIYNNTVFEIQQFVPFPEKININEAGLDLLKTLPGIGERRAKSIIAHRETIGWFKDIRDLENISGLHPSLIQRIIPYVQF